MVFRGRVDTRGLGDLSPPKRASVANSVHSKLRARAYDVACIHIRPRELVFYDLVGF